MRCTKCGTDNPEGAGFCIECAAPFARRCAACGNENPARAKFCARCAKPLESGAAAAPRPAAPALPAAPRITVGAPALDSANAAPDGERKTVTALFADIKGSTELEQDLDPEEARAIVDPALKLMIEAVQRYDGYVVQSTGDGIFAIFGAPLAHEDHPQRALYAAFRMQEELRRYSTKLVADGGNPLQCRVGVNTGEVVVRSISTGGRTEYTPIGHTTNLASRMQAVAPVGSIAVAEPTRNLCEGYFTLKPLGPTKVRGVSEPVNVYEVTGLGPLRTRLQRAAGRGLTKFVGREREMDAMKAAAERSQAGHGQIVAAMAEAGTGKSRLFFEFKVKNQSGWMVLEAFSVSHGKASAYLPVLDLLHSYFDIKSEDDARKRREKVAGRLAILDPALEDTRPYLFALLGIVEGDDPLAQMDAQVKKRRTLEAIKRILLRESLNQPLIVIFEDLHWIDEQTQELLNLLTDSIANAKILLLVNYRPQYSHSWNSKTYYTQLRLDPLGKESADEMLAALLGDGAQLEALKHLIIEKTEGNPFFMEETVQVLLDESALVRQGSAVRLTRPISELKIPPTVQGILAARIDRLSADEKELLQTLGVLGREFPLGLVRRVTSKSDADLNRMLSELQLGEFIYEQPAVGDTEYIFKHALTQEVTYNSILTERRKLVHQRAGQALESMFASNLEDHLSELAHHYSRGDTIEKAVEYLGRAGNQAMQRSAYNDAISGLSAAIDLLQRLPDTPERARRELLLQLAVGPVSITTKGWGAEEVRRAYIRARQLCEQLGDPPEEFFPTLYGLWLERLIQGELPKSYELAQEFMQRAESAQDPAIQLYGRYVLGNSSLWMGEFVSAREHFEAAIAFYDPERHRTLSLRFEGVDPNVNNLTLLAAALWHLGYPDQALARSNEAIALGERLSHPRSLARALFFAGTLHQFRRDVPATQATAESVLALSAEHGINEWLGWATALRGWAISAQGHHDEGIAQLREGLAMSRATGLELLRAYFLCLLAEAHIRAGHLEDGLDALTEAAATVEEREERQAEAEIYRLKGELLRMKSGSNAGEARKCFELAIEISRTQSAKSLELHATTSLARLLDNQGKRDDARAMLAEIYNWFTEGFDTADLKDAKALLDELSN